MRILKGMLLPFRVVLLLLLSVIDVAMFPLRILRTLCRIGVGLGLMSVFFFNQPLKNEIGSIIFVFVAYVILEIIVALPRLLAEFI